jgi:hypothetical protein
MNPWRIGECILAGFIVLIALCLVMLGVTGAHSEPRKSVILYAIMCFQRDTNINCYKYAAFEFRTVKACEASAVEAVYGLARALPMKPFLVSHLCEEKEMLA